MPTSIVTTEDLKDFKNELLEELKQFVSNNASAPKKWLKSSEVMELLKISPGTLQTLRINGTIPYTKIGGLIYYEASEIDRVMEENRVKFF